jgi:hypothetical protein
MTNPLYTSLQGSADRMVSKFGSPSTIISVTEPDPIEGGEQVPTEHPCRAVVMTYDQRYVNGTTILSGDVLVYISAIGLQVEPKPGMPIAVGGRTYLIISVDPNRYDGQTPVVYVCQARSAS